MCYHTVPDNVRHMGAHYCILHTYILFGYDTYYKDNVRPLSPSVWWQVMCYVLCL